MATLNLGRIKPVFRDAYSGSTAYVVDDIVTHGDECFICIQAHGAGEQATSQTAYWKKLAAKGTDGTDVGTTITTQGDILYRDGSGLQRLAKGTAGQALKMNTAANAPEWGTISSDCVKVASYDISGTVSDINLDNIFTSDYRFYRLVYTGIGFDGAGSGSWMRIGFRTGGSSGANHGGTYYQKYVEQYGDEGSKTDSQGHQSDSTGVQVMNTWNSQTSSSNSTYYSYYNSGYCDFYDPIQDDYKPSFLFQNQWNDNNHIGWTVGLGYNNSKISTGGITGIRFNAENHNFNRGRIRVYGFKS